MSRHYRAWNWGKQVALENVDAEKLDLISAEAQKQVNLINGTIGNLRLSLELADDPAEIQQILEAIKTLTRSRFAVLRRELEAVRETLKPEEFQQALEGLNLGEQLALQNIDTERFDAISAEAQKQVGLINGAIENLRLSLELTDNLTEQQEILTAIKVLTQGRFAILRKELADIKDTLDPDEYEQALEGLNLGEQLSLQNLDTEKFSRHLRSSTRTDWIDKWVDRESPFVAPVDGRSNGNAADIRCHQDFDCLARLMC